MLSKMEKDNLEIFILASLKNAPSYGYKIINDLSSVISISESTLYPILKRLEDKNELSTYSVETQGRTRKYFRIEKNGLNRLDQFDTDIKNILNIYTYILNLK